MILTDEVGLDVQSSSDSALIVEDGTTNVRTDVCTKKLEPILECDNPQKQSPQYLLLTKCYCRYLNNKKLLKLPASIALSHKNEKRRFREKNTIFRKIFERIFRSNGGKLLTFLLYVFPGFFAGVLTFTLELNSI